ncbi:MAG: preprotein translocase subunit SecE [Candidatus Taylorbacteria bacterium]|nr:preprotein translocase subunit SecE [Candidatus Taylorbacteria bacterium]
MSRLSNYILDTKGELKHVCWPTKKQTTMFTLLVIFISIVVSVYLGFFDYIFSFILRNSIL